MPESDPDTCWYDHTCLYAAQGRLKPTESIGVDFGPPPRMLAYASHSGWANQLVALAHALHLAQHLGRALVVPRVVRLGDVLDDGGCYGHPPPTEELWERYERFRSRPPLDAFIDTSAWPVKRVLGSHFDAPVANRVPPLPHEHWHYVAPNVCAFEKSANTSLLADGSETGPFLAPYATDAAAAAHLLRLGSTFTLYPKPNCAFCAIKYRTDLRHRALRLLCTVAGVCEKGTQSWRTVEYDAIHLRLTPPYPSAYNVTARLQSALRGSGGHGGSSHSRPLYVASDQVEQALKLIRELVARGEAPGRRVLSYYDLDPKLAVNLFGSERASDAEYAYMRPLLTDAMLCVGARRFTPTAGTFSGHILGMRACAASRRVAQASSAGGKAAACPEELLPYDYGSNCPSFKSCALPGASSRIMRAKNRTHYSRPHQGGSVVVERRKQLRSPDNSRAAGRASVPDGPRLGRSR